MKITNEQTQQIMQAYGVKGAGKAKKPGAADSAQKADDASLSAASQEITKALSLISKSPDVRPDKVAALKAQIEAGTYQVSGKDIAGAILGQNAGF